MAAAFDRALAHFIVVCRYVIAAHDLVTKWRIELAGGYTLDLYFNETLGKYGYTLVMAATRVLGWDNAPIILACLTSPTMCTGRMARSNLQHLLAILIMTWNGFALRSKLSWRRRAIELQQLIREIHWIEWQLVVASPVAGFGLINGQSRLWMAVHRLPLRRDGLALRPGFQWRAAA